MSLAASGDPHDVHAILAEAGDAATLPPGEVRLMWHVVSADGHPVGGSFLFFVGTSAVRDTVPIPEPSTCARRHRLGSGHRGRATHSGGSARNRRWMSARAVRAAVVHRAVGCEYRPSIARCARAVRRHAAVSRSAFARVDGECIARPSSRLGVARHVDREHRGKGRALRTGLALLPLWALALARRSGLALALTLPSLLVSAAVGHSAAIHPMWAVPFKAIHLAALAVWIGGLLWIVVRERDDEASATTDIMRVSTLALWAVVIVTLSGIVQTLILVQSVTAVRSPYGAVVVAKIVGVLILVAFGAYHRRRLLPAIAARGREAVATLQSSVARELLVFCVVILLGGFLAYLTPPVSGDAHASSHSAGTVP